MDAADAAALVPDEGTVLLSGIGAGPKVVPHELAASGRDLSLSLPASADGGLVADTELVMADAVELRFPFAAWPSLQDAINDGTVGFVDDHFSDVAAQVECGQFGDPDVAVIEAVAVGEDWLIPTTAVGSTPTFVHAADEIIVEVNQTVPLATQHVHDAWRLPLPPRDPIPLEHPGERLGDPFVEFDPAKLSAVVHTDQPPAPYPFREIADEEQAITDLLIDFLADELAENPVLQDRFTFEVGVGTLGDAIMSELGDLDVGDREVCYFGEVIQDGLLDLIDDGVLSAASATGLVFSGEGLERFYDDADRYVDHLVTRPMNISNNPALIRRFGVVAINNAVEVDLYGNANSSHVCGSQVVQGIGGSGDFARNSALSIMALPSTAKDGAASRIVPMCSHVDQPDHDIDVVITEQGVADLRGKTPRERADTIVENCAHPAFSSELQGYRGRADASGGHMPQDLPTAFDMHDA